MAELKGIYILWYREVLRLRRDRPRLVASLGAPLLYLVAFGFGLRTAVGGLMGGIDFTQFLFPGILSMTVFMTALMSGMSVVWEREMGFLKEVLVAPLPRWAMVIGKSCGGATMALVQGLVMLILSPLVGVQLSIVAVLTLIPLFLLIAFALSALGVFVASITYTMERFQVMINLLFMPLLFLSGIFFPVVDLPGWLQTVVTLNPISYGVDAVRRIVLGPGVPSIAWFGQPVTIAQDILVMAALGLAAAMLGIWSFSRQD